MPYLNVTEVESALSVATAAPYSGFTQLITLPNLTWEGRQCHAIKIANGSGHWRPGVFFLGGVHAREWGSADILINFVEQLEQAFGSGTGLAFGSRTFSAADIRGIVDTLDIIVFPQANPDGRNYSMTADAMWRKNRRTAAPNSAACPGVDINRNYDFLWDFPTYFNPAAGVVDSTDPCDAGFPDNGTYHGPAAFSEPETQNAKWVFDAFPQVGYFVDVHSYSEDILYSWGDDEDQSADPSMNFTNPAFDGARGMSGDAYREYIPPGDFATAISLANVMHDGVKAFRGTDYTVKSAYNLYPTAGTSQDYAYSRHFTDPGKRKVISYTVEWGLEFQPPYSEMQNIIQEITCGLLAFCHSVREIARHSHRQAGRGWTGKITGLIYDHSGDFAGFILETDPYHHHSHHHDDHHRRFYSREKAIAELAHDAWHHRLRVTVDPSDTHPDRPHSITIHQPPAPFSS
jgi:carboxypeptidase T